MCQPYCAFFAHKKGPEKDLIQRTDLGRLLEMDWGSRRHECIVEKLSPLVRSSFSAVGLDALLDAERAADVFAQAHDELMLIHLSDNSDKLRDEIIYFLTALTRMLHATLESSGLLTYDEIKAGPQSEVFSRLSQNYYRAGR